jgi:hypothetical protein
MRTKLKVNRVKDISTPFKVMGITAGLIGVSGLIYKGLATGLNAGFGPSAGYARGFAEISPLNVEKSGILAGSILVSVGALTAGIGMLLDRK